MASEYTLSVYRLNTVARLSQSHTDHKSERAAKAYYANHHANESRILSAHITTCSVRSDGTKHSFCSVWEKLPAKRWRYTGMQ